MQYAIDGLADYCKLWKLKVNIEKTKIIRFSKRRSKNVTVFNLNGELIENVDSYIYLGTTIKFNGKFQDAKNKQILQARKALSAIYSQKEKLQLPLDIYLNLFDTLVSPVLLYGCEIWGYEGTENLEIFFRSFLRKTLKLNDQTSNYMVYGECGKMPLNLIIQLRMINFWLHITSGNENKLVFQVYSLLRQMHNNKNYSSPWIIKIEKIFNDCGMGNLWQNQHIENPIWIKKAIKLRLSDMFLQEWHSKITEMSSCTFYKMFKSNLILEKYLLKLDISERINLCKFRCRNTKIPIHILGYAAQNIARENRLCTICDLNEVDDKYHYIMKCSFFQSIR